MILYIGNYQSENITRLRGIPFRNAAGSNRIFRLAKALFLNGREIEIISPATSLRSKPVSKQACLEQHEELDGIKVYYARVHHLPFLNLIFSVFSIIKRIKRYKGQLEAVIIYNFSIEFVIITSYIKLFTNIKIINNVEDIYLPKWSDWKRSSEVNALQQLIFFFCMKAVGYQSNGFIVPTKKFLPYLPIKGKIISLTTGCCEIYQGASFDHSKSIKLLYSGKVDSEFGIQMLINSLDSLDSTTAEKMQVNICGSGSKASWLRDQLENNQKLAFVNYLGFVTDEDYSNLLENTDICLSLQNPTGRHESYKTPSKFYEFYSYGKCVITSNAGDYSVLPRDSFILCEPYHAEHLASILTGLIENTEKIGHIKKQAYQYAKEHFDFSIVGKQMIDIFDI